jgi:mitochondrial enoyl-[acyl-carrier protein] reductase / trans-2-enoyl-CoA reductase
LRTSTGVAGSVACGVVSAVPSGERQFAVNDAVLVFGNGVWTDSAVVAEGGVRKLPNLPAEEAAALPNFLAAWALLHNYSKLAAGDVVIQCNGTSAIGAAVSQIGKSLGLKVVNISDADCTSAELAAKLKEAGKSKLVISGHSGKHLVPFQKALVHGGSMVVYNAVFQPLSASSDVASPISNVIFSDIGVHGFDLATWALSDAKGYTTALDAVLGLAKDKKVELKPAHVFAQSDYLKAIEEVTKSGAAVVLKH